MTENNNNSKIENIDERIYFIPISLNCVHLKYFDEFGYFSGS